MALIVPVAAPAILSFSMCVLCVYNVSAAKRTCSVRCSKMEVGCATLLARYPPQQALCYTSATEYHAASATEYHAASATEYHAASAEQYYLQKWGLHNRSQIPSDSENRRQIGGYIIAPKSHLTAKTEGRSGVT